MCFGHDSESNAELEARSAEQRMIWPCRSAFRPPRLEIWSARQDLHLRSPGPRPGMLLLHHALFAPVRTEHTGDLFSWGMRDLHTLNLSPAVRF